MTLHEALREYIRANDTDPNCRPLSESELDLEADALMKVIDPFVIAYVQTDVRSAYEEFNRQ